MPQNRTALSNRARRIFRALFVLTVIRSYSWAYVQAEIGGYAIQDRAGQRTYDGNKIRGTTASARRRIPKLEGHYNSQLNLRCQVLMVCMPVMGAIAHHGDSSGLRVFRALHVSLNQRSPARVRRLHVARAPCQWEVSGLTLGRFNEMSSAFAGVRKVTNP